MKRAKMIEEKYAQKSQKRRKIKPIRMKRKSLGVEPFNMLLSAPIR